MWYQPITDPREAELALKWAYSLGITAALPPGEEELEFLAIETAMKIKAPITEPEIDELKKLALQLNPTFREGKLVLAPWMQETNLA